MTFTTVLVSGANQGIGFEIAKKLATERKDYYILLGSRDLSKGEEAAKMLTGLAGSVQAIQLDITSDDSIAACVAHIENEFERLDVLVNNAGIGYDAYESEPMLRKRMAKCLDTNVYGAACLTEACIPMLSRAKVPRIVMVSSEMGSIGNALDPGFPYYSLANVDTLPYKASKAALNMVGAVYAVKYREAGFKVNVCCPGLCKTNLSAATAAIAGPASEGAIEACRLATLDEDGENGAFSNIEGVLPW